MEAEQVAKQIKIPLYSWEGNCHAIATQLLKAEVVKGRVARGHYYGFVDENSIFFGKPIIPHSWIELEDGSICDPTRWCFEQLKPYIYFGPYTEEYDLSGDAVRLSLQRDCPRIERGDGELLQPFENIPAYSLVSSLIHNQLLFSRDQLFWLANLSMNQLTPHTKEVYQGLVKVGLKAAIPIDNYNYVMGK